jgi:AraC-like DNA-binding protein
MYTNSAYLGEVHEDIVDYSKPILVTAVGYYRVHTSPVIKTTRPDGRGDYQLIYIGAGKLHLYENGQERIISKGNMLLFRPGQQQFYNLYAADKPETYWVHFTGSEVEALLDYYGMPKDKSVFFTGTSPDYQWLFRQMIQELQLFRANYDDLLNINLRHVFLMISRFLKERTKHDSDTLNEVERAAHFFNENYNRNISIKKYASEHHISECWFNRTFKQVIKLTPMQYIIQIRITNAINLLESTRFNIIQIANAVGYDDAYYFSRLFRKHTGVSPTEYRKRIKTN